MGSFSTSAIPWGVSIGATALFIAAVALWLAIAPPATGAQRQRISMAKALVMLAGLVLILAGIAGGLASVYLIALDGYQEDVGSGRANTADEGALVLVVSLTTLLGGILAIRKALHRARRTER